MNKLSNLREIQLVDCVFDDDSITIFAKCIVRNVMLSMLVVKDPSYCLTEVGLVTIFAALLRSKCRLKKLDLACNSRSPVRCLTLKYLSLEFIDDSIMSTASWNTVFHFLRSPESSTLEDFKLDAFCDNEGIAALTNTLANNGMLRQ